MKRREIVYLLIECDRIRRETFQLAVARGEDEPGAVRKADEAAAGNWNERIKEGDGEIDLSNLWLVTEKGTREHGYFPSMTDASRPGLEGGYCSGSVVAVGEDKLNFSGFKFPRAVDFSGTKFTGQVWFDRAQFGGEANFEGAHFCDVAVFWDAKFAEGAIFKGVVFNKAVDFENVTVSGKLDFSVSKFEGDAFFSGLRAQHPDGANFTETEFSRYAFFHRSEFDGSAEFWRAKFSSLASFIDARFKGEARFETVHFMGETQFIDAVFDGFAHFGGVNCEGSLILDRSYFAQFPPDFRQAHFKEAPMLDCLASRKPRTKWFGDRIRRLLGSGNAHRMIPFRTLKRIAIEGRDHESELRYFGKELSSIPYADTRYVVSKLYFMFSRHGRCYVTPLAFWCFQCAAFALYYLWRHYSAYPGFHNVSGQSSYLEWLSLAIQYQVGDGAKLRPVFGCIIDGALEGDVISSALRISLRKSLFGIGGDLPKFVEGDYQCLYGAHVPEFVFMSGMAQSIISAILLFLFVLAIKNRFKIK